MKKFHTEFNLLTQKLNLYKEIEDLSQQMPSLLDADELITMFEKRHKLLLDVKKIDNTLTNLLETQPLLKDTINIEAKRQDLDSDYRSIYDLSFKIKGIINRVVKNDHLIRDHIEYQKEQVLSKIKNLNQSPETVAVKYNFGVQTSQSNYNSSKKSRFI